MQHNFHNTHLVVRPSRRALHRTPFSGHAALVHTLANYKRRRHLSAKRKCYHNASPLAALSDRNKDAIGSQGPPTHVHWRNVNHHSIGFFKYSRPRAPPARLTTVACSGRFYRRTLTSFVIVHSPFAVQRIPALRRIERFVYCLDNTQARKWLDAAAAAAAATDRDRWTARLDRFVADFLAA